MENKLTIIDFFCGAGGFSEGFRQQGFKIVQGIDYWKPAIDTHNLNHKLQDKTKSVLDFWSDDDGNVNEIEALDDTLGIIGSPPCVSFSNSNKSGNADKTQGIKLIKSFLRVIAVKKHKPNSKLKFWYMENVPNSQKYVNEKYSFIDLNLGKWAKSIGKNPNDSALFVQENGDILNSGDYGAPQSRLRFICGEWCETNKFLSPKKTHENNHITLGNILENLPKPNSLKSEVLDGSFIDPNYNNLKVDGKKLTDHFYDTGLYIIEWDEAEYLKRNHSYMGKMSFPENMNKPCRTIMATRSAKTRESLILKSEYKRRGNGEYRLPTIREIASLMGFPLNYQFTGSEGSKWRQIGNAVSPHLSAALAKCVRKKLGLRKITPSFSDLDKLYEKVEIKLNTFKKASLKTPKKRGKNAKFRKHPYKSGNLTVELMNYLDNKSKPTGNDWYIKMYFGTGKNHTEKHITESEYLTIVNFLETNINTFQKFKVDFWVYHDNIRLINKNELQYYFENDLNLSDQRNPINILKEIDRLIQKRKEKDDMVKVDFIQKGEVPLGQLYVIYCLGKFIF